MSRSSVAVVPRVSPLSPSSRMVSPRLWPATVCCRSFTSSYGCVMATCTHAVPSPASASALYATFCVFGSICICLSVLYSVSLSAFSGMMPTSWAGRPRYSAVGPWVLTMLRRVPMILVPCPFMRRALIVSIGYTTVPAMAADDPPSTMFSHSASFLGGGALAACSLPSSACTSFLSRVPLLSASSHPNRVSSTTVLPGGGGAGGRPHTLAGLRTSRLSATLRTTSSNAALLSTPLSAMARSSRSSSSSRLSSTS
mmetsp:Transcript_8423/g.21029  ORF Transcript_8423/g.21029 Transcript_8423/m.21029 type:complete len:255 (-) Transcript_8423:787-1551(-)